MNQDNLGTKNELQTQQIQKTTPLTANPELTTPNTPQITKLPLSVNLVALWLFLLGFFGIILTGIILISSYLFISSTSSVPDNLQIPFLISSLVSGLLVFVLSVFLFRIRSGVRKLQEQSYKGAKNFLTLTLIASIIFSILQLTKNQISSAAFTLLSQSFNLLALVYLIKNKNLFSSQEGNKLSKKVVIIFICLYLTAGTTFVILYKITSQQIANFARPDVSISTTRPPKSQTATPTPLQEATSWKTYTNSDYHFSLEYPTDWNVKEYPATRTAPITIAFNSNPLPDNFDINGIYESVSLYPTSDSINYAIFQKRLSDAQSGNSKIHVSYQIAGVMGEQTYDKVSVEHNGFFFEVYGQMTSENGAYMFTPISLHMIDSFRFLQ